MIWRNASPTSRSEPVTPGPLRVRRVAEHQIDAAVADLGEPADVGPQPVDGRVVELVVAGVEDPQPARLEHDRDRVRHRVRHADELGAERADLDGALVRPTPRCSSVACSEPVLVELRLEEAERQPRAPDLGHLHLAHQVRQRADVVLVRVREEHRANPVRPVAQVREVREDEIDAEMLVAREREARVDDDDLVVRLVDHHVLADLAEAPERE